MKKGEKFIKFPAFLVHYDGGLTAYFDIGCWADDVDQWYHSTADDYIVDSDLNVFVQDLVSRDIGGQPDRVPDFKWQKVMERDYFEHLVTNDGQVNFNSGMSFYDVWKILYEM